MVPTGAMPVIITGETASAPTAANQAEIQPPMPNLGFVGDGHVISNMRQIIPYVTGHLRQVLKRRDEFNTYFADVAPHLHQPLAIHTEDTLPADAMTAYKLPWTTTNAKTSLESTGMFEAAGNVLWVCPYPPTDDGGKNIAGEVRGWSDVTEIAETCFSADAYQTTHAASQGSVARITFPVMLALYAANVPHVLLDAFPSSLALLTGHVYVYAWYWAVFGAINTNNYGLIAALWQAGLSVTIHCRVGMTESERAVLSIAMSESRKASARLSDGFMGFALKALLIVKQSSATSKLAVLNQLGVRFNGSPVSKAMLTGILIFDDKMTPASKQALVNIEEKFGKEPLTSGYVKISRISGVCSGNASGMSETSADLMEYVLEFLWWALQYEMVTPGNVTIDYLVKSRDGTLGVVHIALGRKQIYNTMSAWVEDLGRVPGATSLATDLGLIMRHFSTYTRFLEAFPLNTTHAESQGPDVENESGTQVDDPVDGMKEK